VAARAARKLEYIDLTTSLDDLKVPPGNRLHTLKGDRTGDGDAYDVEVCDYH